MDEHKKQHIHHNDHLHGPEWHEYTDGVHSGKSYSQDLADKAYQDAKKEDKEYKFYFMEPEEDSLKLWNHEGNKVDRGSDTETSEDSNNDSDSSGKDGCFITTACMVSRGLSDDCYELETLRNFRNTYLKSMVNGNLEIENYYKIAPQIVATINKKSDSKLIWETVYQRLKVSIAYIENKENEQAYKSYKDLVSSLSKLV